jgi:hypothetical protein
MSIFQENSDFQNSLFERVVTKDDLTTAMGISPTTFRKLLKEIEPEIIEKFPKYNKYRHQLNPRLARFIVDSLGYDIEVIRRNIKS